MPLTQERGCAGSSPPECTLLARLCPAPVGGGLSPCLPLVTRAVSFLESLADGRWVNCWNYSAGDVTRIPWPCDTPASPACGCKISHFFIDHRPSPPHSGNWSLPSTTSLQVISVALLRVSHGCMPISTWRPSSLPDPGKPRCLPGDAASDPPRSSGGRGWGEHILEMRMPEGPHPQGLVLSVETPVTLSPSCTTKNSSRLRWAARTELEAVLPRQLLSSSWKHVCVPCAQEEVRPNITPGRTRIQTTRRLSRSRRCGCRRWYVPSQRGGCGPLGHDLAHCSLTLCRQSVRQGPGSPEPTCHYSEGRVCRSPASSLSGQPEECPKLLRTQYPTRAHHLLE